MKFLKCALLAVLLAAGAIDLAEAQGIFGGGSYPDPCQLQTIPKQSAAINIVTATTTQLVAAIQGQSVFVCGFSFTLVPAASGTDTAALEYGTGASCGTGTTALTGTYCAGGATAGPPLLISHPQGATAFKTPQSNALCLLSAGTTVNVQGVLTYVQQ
jgi:hypothetical protein